MFEKFKTPEEAARAYAKLPGVKEFREMIAEEGYSSPNSGQDYVGGYKKEWSEYQKKASFSGSAEAAEENQKRFKKEIKRIDQEEAQKKASKKFDKEFEDAKAIDRENRGVDDNEKPIGVTEKDISGQVAFSRGGVSRGRSGSETNEQGMVQREQEALDKIAPKSIEVAPSNGVSTAPNNEFLFNKIKDLESASAPNPSYHPGAGETSVETSGMTTDYLFDGITKVTIPAKTTNFLKITKGNPATASWVAAMPETQDEDAVVIDVTKNRIYLHGFFAG